MIPGFPTTCPPGDHEDFIEALECQDIGGGLRARFTPREDYGQVYRLLIDGLPASPPLYCAAEEPAELRGPYELGGVDHVAAVAPMGDWFDDSLDLTPQLTLWEAARADRIYAEIDTQPAFAVYGVNSQLSSLALTGLQRFANCRPVEGRPTWGQLDLTIDDTAGTRTVELLLDGVVICSGSRVGDGSITLAEQNDSGVSGSVIIAYTGDVATGGYALIRWPAQLKIHYKTSTFSGGDFPRTAEATLYDDGRSNTFRYRSDVLAAGSYYVVVHQVDECGNEGTGTQSGGAAVTVYAPPAKPGKAAYVSGDQSNTAINWTASATAAVTYNIYDSGTSGILDLDAAPVNTASTSATLASLADPTFTGIRRILVRATKAGIEEGSTQILELEYASGAVIVARPPKPGVGKQVSTSGLTLTVPVTIDTAEQAVAAATVELFLFAVGASPNYSSADGTANVASAGSSAGLVTKLNVSALASGAGLWMYAVRTKSAAGNQSQNAETYGPIQLTTTPLADPAGIEARNGS